MKQFHPLIYLAIGGCLALLPYLVAYLANQDRHVLSKADAYYVKGSDGNTIAEKEHNFNQAFQIYKRLESAYQPDYGSGKLYYNLGNTLFQLDQPAEALYYYLKAKKLQPRNSEIESNIQAASEALGLRADFTDSIWHKVLFFHFKWSLPERLILVAVLSFLCFALFSCFIWLDNSVFFNLGMIASLALLVIVGSVLYTRYLETGEGVIVKSTVLYKDAGYQYAKLETNPLPAGSVIAILDIRKKGNWIKVQTPDGKIGYVFYENIRLF